MNHALSKAIIIVCLLISIACNVASLTRISPADAWQQWYRAHDSLEDIAFRNEAQEVSRSELQKAATEERDAAKYLSVKTGLGKLLVQASTGLTLMALIAALIMRNRKPV